MDEPSIVTQHDSADYEIEIRIRNARILNLMRRAGIASASELARKSGITPTSVGRLLNLKVTPLSRHTPDYRREIWLIADALHCHPDDMFSDRQRTTYLATNKKAIEVSEAEVEGHLAAIEAMPPDEIVRLAEQKTILNEAMATLTPREQKVIKLRFGLDGETEHILDEVAAIINISRERVRQLETRALRKLASFNCGQKLAAVVAFPTKKVVTSGLTRMIAASRPDTWCH